MSRPSINVLVLLDGKFVTCAGAGTIKALKMSSIDCVIHAAAPEHDLGPLYLADHSAISPHSNDSSFIEWITEYCHHNEINVLLCDSSDFVRISGHKDAIERACGVRVLLQPSEVIAIAEDKLRTSRWLMEHNLSHPGFAAGDNSHEVAALVRKHGFPLIAKPYVGHGSVGVVALHNERDLARALHVPNTLIQQYVGTSKSEYTVNCFVDQSGAVQGLLSLRRRLWNGMSLHCEVDPNPSILELGEAIAVKIGARGSTNLQLRLHEGVAMCLEINARFSGSTAIRARLGYNDVEYAFSHYVFDEPARPLPVITEGVALRFVEEIYPASLA